MKRQTAVEFLVSKIASLIDDEYWSNQQNITKQVNRALDMERDQIIDAYRADVYPCSKEDAEDYYNNTYKK